MACIKSASRSALTAFAPDAPYMAAGTLAGAVDLSFSSSSSLEIFGVDLQSQTHDLPIAGSCPSSERFCRLSWGKPTSPSDDFSLGLVAGGLSDGTIGVWNPNKLILRCFQATSLVLLQRGIDEVFTKGSSDDPGGAFVARLEKHTGAVRGLEFCSLSPNLLASGADEGELCIWDMKNPSEPNMFPPLKNSGSGAQGEISFVSWNPKFQHILASSTYNGMAVVWDLRNQKPLTSFSDSMKRRCSVLQWNPDISTQLIVASDDDSSPSLKLWDVRKTISPVIEFLGHTKGVIAMSWCPADSSLLLTCAKDNRTISWDTTSGEIICELPASTNWNFDVHWYPKIPGIISASSFDGKIGIYNIEACSRARASEGDFGTPARLRAPKWLKRPVGVSFGFGGKVVSFQPGSSQAGVPPTSEVFVHSLVTEQSLVNRSTEFQTAINNGERSSLRALCERKSQDSELEDDREAWGFLRVMFEDEGTARTKLLGHLGFSLPATDGAISEDLHTELIDGLRLDDDVDKVGTNGKEDLSAFTMDNGEEFFNNSQPVISTEHDGQEAVNEVVQQEQSELAEVSDPSTNENIQRALIVGDYKGAVLHCLSANRIADALVIAHVSGPDLWKSTRDQYLKKSSVPYLKVVSALVNNDLMTLITMRPLSSWKETMALLCTFAQKEEWTVLCDALASKLLSAGNALAATLCYICAGNIDKTVEIWSRHLKGEREGRAYVDLLQDLMEKTIVLALATGQKQFSAAMSKLVANYAELLASQGLLTTAMDYLKVLGLEDSSNDLLILRDRILLSTQDRGAHISSQSESVQPQAEAIYNPEPSSLNSTTGSYQYYQDTQYQQQQVAQQQVIQQQQILQPQTMQPSVMQPQAMPQVMQPAQPVPAVPYSSGYQQQFNSYNAYQTAESKQMTQTPPFQAANTPQMFIPSQPTHTPPGPATSVYPPASVFAPTSTYPPTSSYPPGLSGQGHLPYGSSQIATVPTVKFSPAVAPTMSRGFSQVPSPSFVPGSSLGPVQPPSPTEPAQTQPVAAPAAPPPTVQTVDTSNVTAELKPVILTLTNLYKETSEALGGSRAIPAKRREIDDNSKKIGALFAKLNNQDLSPNASTKLIQLCQALDVSDYTTALRIQVILTTSDWDECNFWLAALKRMIKTRQNMRPH